MANPPDSAGSVPAGPRRRRSARREQGPPQTPVAGTADAPSPAATAVPLTTPPAESRVRLDRLVRKRARKPRRGAAVPQAVEPAAESIAGSNTREGRRSRHRIRGQQSGSPSGTPSSGPESDQSKALDVKHQASRHPDASPADAKHSEGKHPEIKHPETKHGRTKQGESNHVEPPARSADRARDVENLPRTARDRRNELAERALRGLVTTRGTQVSWTAALRARDVASPTADDMAEAERDLVIVRRNYTPPEPLPNSRKAPPEQHRQERPARRGQRQSGKGF